MLRSDDYISLSEASKLSGYSSEHIRRLCVSGQIKGTKIGSTWMTTIEQVKLLNPEIKAAQISKEIQTERKTKFEGQKTQNSDLNQIVKKLEDVADKFSKQVPVSSNDLKKQGKNFLPVSIRKIVLLICLTGALSAPVFFNLFGLQDQITELKTQYSQISFSVSPQIKPDDSYIKNLVSTTVNNILSFYDFKNLTVVPGSSFAKENTQPEQTNQISPEPNVSQEGYVLGVSTNSELVAAIKSVVADPNFIETIRGPVGPPGPPTQYIPNSGSVFGVTAPTASQGNVGTIGSATYLSSRDFETEKLTVTSESSFTGGVALSGSLSVTGTSTFAGDMLPATDNTYELGTSDMRFKTLHLGPNSLIVHNDTTDTAKVILGFSSNIAKLSTDATSALQLSTGVNNGINIDISGNVGIGTTTPIETFQVNNGATTAFVVSSNGNVGIGTTTPGTSLDVVGTIRGSNGLTISSGTINLPNGQIDNTELANSSLTITAGAGLINGGAVSLGSTTTLNIGAGTCITSNADDVSITADCISDTQLQYNTGQHLTTSSTPTFAGLTLNGNLSLGANTLTTSNTTVVTNLNSDLWDGYQFSDYLDQAVKTSSSPTFSTVNTGQGAYELYAMNQNVLSSSSPTFAGLTLNGNLSLGANTLTISNTTVVTNLNSDLLDGQHGTYYMSASTDNWVNTSGDTMTGTLTFSGTSTDITTSGVEHLALMPGGNVGVGTTSPGSKLEVTGDIRITSGSGGQIIFADGSTMGSSGLGSAAALSSATDAIVTGDSDANGSGDIILKTGSNDRLHILNTGNIGIGLTNPGYKLQINGSVAAGTGPGFVLTDWGRISGNLTFNNLSTDTSSGIVRGRAAGGLDFLYNNSGWFTGMTLNENSNVGIGTTTPTTKLDVIGAIRTNGYELNANDFRFVSATNDALSISGSTASNLGGNIQVYGSTHATLTNNVQIRYGSNVTATFDESGNVGIGTTTPVFSFEVAGSDITKRIVQTQYSDDAIGSGFIGRKARGTAALPTTVQSGDYLTGLFGRGYNGTEFVPNASQVSIMFYAAENFTPTTMGTYMKFLTTNIGSASATEKMRILDTGNVGIGTTTPGAKLEIGVDTSTSSGDGLIIKNLATTDGGTTTTPNTWIKFYLNSLRNAGMILSGRDSAYGSAAQADSNLQFYTALDDTNTERMRITSDGNVGIGTTVPDQKLKVISGATKTHIAIGASNSYGTGYVTMFSDGASNNNDYFGLGINSVNPQLVVTYPNGNVGIGTTTPGTALQVDSDNNQVIKIRRPAAGVIGGVGLDSQAAANRLGLYLSNIEQVAFYDTGLALGSYAAGTAQPPTGGAIISGNVGIGTTIDPLGSGSKLFVNGGGWGINTFYSAANDSAIVIRNTGSKSFITSTYGSTGSYTPLGIEVNGSERLTINTSGNVGIGTTNPLSTLDVRGASQNVFNFSAITGTNPVYGTFNNSGGTYYIGVEGSGGGTINVGGTAYALGITAAGGKKLQLGYNAGTGVALTVDTTGNIGIGTTTPQYKLAFGTYADKIGEYIDATHYNSIEFFNGTTGGMYFDQQAGGTAGYHFSYAGSEKVTIQTDGNVGIGTTTPSPYFPSGSPKGLEIANNGPAVLRLNDTSAVNRYFDIAVADEAVIGTYYSTLSTIRIQAYGNTYFGASGAEKMTILNNGYVGIGTSSPGTSLQVAGTIRSGTNSGGNLVLGGGATVNGWSSIALTGSNTATNWLIAQNDTVSGAFEIIPSTVAGGSTFTTPAFLVSSGGNVGIGTPSPNGKLDIGVTTLAYSQRLGIKLTNDADASTGVIIERAANDTSLWMGYNTTADGFQISSSYGTTGAYKPITFWTSSAERVRINTSGNVGINTNNPGAPLHVVKEGSGGDVEIARFDGIGSNDNPYITIGTNASGGGAFLSYNQNTNLFRVDRHGGNAANYSFAGNGGNFGIGTTSPNGKLNIRGASTNATAQTYNGLFVLDSSDATTSLQMGITTAPFASGSWIQSYNEPATATGNYALLLNPIGGNVGIGTTNPGTTLHSLGADNRASVIGGSTYYGGGSRAFVPAYGDQYGNGSAYDSGNSGTYGGKAGAYLHGGNSGSYGGGGAGVVAIGGNGLVGNSSDAGGGAGIFAQGGLNADGVTKTYAGYFNGGNVSIMNGNVGIGTTNPNIGKLEVKGGRFWVENGTTTHAIDFIAGTTGSVNTIMSNWDTGDGYLPLALSGRGTFSDFYLSTSGAVGVGTSPKTWDSWYNPLQIGAGGFIFGHDTSAASAGFGSNMYISSGYKRVGTGEAVLLDTEAGTFSFRTAASGSADSAITWTNALSILNSGNVGINTATPVFNLQVGGYPIATAQLWGSGSWTASGVQSWNAGTVNDGTSSAGFHTDSAAAGSYVRLDAGSAKSFTGVAILSGRDVQPNVSQWEIQWSDNDSSWTTTGRSIDLRANYGGWVESRWVVSNNATAHRYWRLYKINGAGGGDYVKEVQFFEGTGQFEVNSTYDGNVGIGELSPAYKLQVNGQPAANGYTAFTNYSDARLKDNVTNLMSDGTSALDKIALLRPVTFNYNSLTGYDEKSRSRRVSGFIAQELQTIFPEMVGTTTINGTEYLDTNLSDLPLFLVKAIQELKDKVTILESTNGQLVNQQEQQGITLNNVKAIVSISGMFSVDELGNLIVQNVNAKKGNFESLTVKNQNQSATGITIFDRTTNQPVCVYSENGILKSEPGECGANVNNTPATNSSSTSDSTPATDPTPVPAPVVEPTSAVAPDPVLPAETTTEQAVEPTPAP